MDIKFGSICSGIESASMAWEPLGWSAAWFAEIEPFPSAVLAHRWPRVTNWGDMTMLPLMIEAGMIEAPEVLVGGTPCQAFSIAGARKGLEDERGQLTLKYVEIADEIDRKRPTGKECIVVWENVPGVLSSKDNAFGCFLAALVGEDDALQPAGKKWSNAGVVYGPKRVAAWRILDAQYFGVAQRRRRVFVVASARDGFDPTQVLFESEGVRRDTAPSRETSDTISHITTSCGEVAPTLSWRDYKGPSCGRDGFVGILIADKQGVRKATEKEYERLQGFPDGYTRIPWRKKVSEDCPAGPRYKAIGNSKAVPVVQWIGKRIERMLAQCQD